MQATQIEEHPHHDVKGLRLPRHEDHHGICHHSHQDDVEDASQAIQVELEQDAEHDVVDVAQEGAVQAVVHEPAIRVLEDKDHKNANLVNRAAKSRCQWLSHVVINDAGRHIANIDELGENFCHFPPKAQQICLYIYLEEVCYFVHLPLVYFLFLLLK